MEKSGDMALAQSSPRGQKNADKAAVVKMFLLAATLVPQVDRSIWSPRN